jgi:2-haloacid dehalogenase
MQNDPPIPTALTRRKFVTFTTGGAALASLHSISQAVAEGPLLRSRIKAVAFDAFPIFDPRPVFGLTEQLFPGKGADLSDEWRTRQFEYTWLRVIARRYVDFWQITQDALEFAADKLGLILTYERREQLMNAYLELKTWPDVVPALTSLKKSGFRLAILSNFTTRMLDASIQSAGLAGMFEQVLSTDQAKTYKPDARGYQLGIDAFKLAPQEILFAAFAGWDAAGAKLFGYPTFWVNRLKQAAEKLGAIPDGMGDGLAELVRFLA